MKKIPTRFWAEKEGELAMKKRTRILLYILLLLLQIPLLPLSAQEKTRINPYIQFQYFKTTDDSAFLKTTITYSSNRMEIPIPGLEISFFSASSGEKLLGTAMTNNDGVARVDLNRNNPVNTNIEGSWVFKTEFKGNDTIEAINSELSIKDVKLIMDLVEADSIKTISLKAVTVENNKEVPVKGEVVMIYVPRMFSMLPVGEATLDDNGTFSMEFPQDIPGDKDGNLTIISRFEENPTFGNVEQKSIIKWGVPSSNATPIAHRALWTKTPPMWMIITLSILLTGVWGHYLFAIISLILIKRDSKKEKKLKH